MLSFWHHNHIIRKANLLAELEISSLKPDNSNSDDHNPEEHLEDQPDDRMQKIIAIFKKYSLTLRVISKMLKKGLSFTFVYM